MTTYTQVATILQKSLGHEEGLLVLEYLEARVPPDVARQRDVQASEATLRLETEQVRAAIRQSESATERKISETEAALRLEIERVRAAIHQSEATTERKISETQAATERKISETEAALRLEIERVRADLTVEIEKVRADLLVKIESAQASQTRWAFLFWLSQIAVLGGLLYQLLR